MHMDDNYTDANSIAGEPEATLCEALCLCTVQYELHLHGAQ